MAGEREPGWYADPLQPEQWRWWDGRAWTEHSVSAHHKAAKGQRPPERAPSTPERAPSTEVNYLVRRWAVLVAAVVLAVAVLAVALRGHPPALYWKGEPMSGVSATLSSAETAMRDLASADEGAISPESRCYFSLAGANDHDVAPYLRCGPVFLPWSSPSAPWLTYGLSVSPEGAGVKISLARQPAPSVTAALAKGETLRRPSGAGPPVRNAGLKVPAVPRQKQGWAGLLRSVPPGLRPAPADDLVGDWGASYRLVGFGTAQWLSSQLDPGALSAAVVPPASAYSAKQPSGRPLAKLLLPPVGQMFVLAELAVSPGESAGAVPRDAEAATSAAVSNQAIADQPVLEVRDGAMVATLPNVAISGVVTLAAAVPAGSDPVLAVSDKGLVQTVSLANGQLGPGPSVLSRAGTDEPLSVTGRLGSMEVHVSDASLVWFAGSDGGTVPPSFDEAYLQVLATVSPLSASFLPASAFSLEEPGGEVVRAQALPDADRQAIAVGFLVPASFSGGTLVVSAGGQSFGVSVRFP
ncbi:MAG: DUF2510 domain-containing protein [Acidimicrobiales bacterium]